LAFKEIAEKVQYPPPLSKRYCAADGLLRFLEGTLYDDAGLTPFDREYTNGDHGKYIYPSERRPSVISNFAGQFMEQCIGLLWADEQFPVIRCYKADNQDEQDTEKEKIVQRLVEAVGLDAIMARATYLGSVGSAAIVVRGLPGPQDGQPWLEVWPGYQCKPLFDDHNPTILTGLVRIYPISAEDLELAGYTIKKEDRGKTFWMRIDLDAKEETRYRPMLEERFKMLGETMQGVQIKWEVDKSYAHSWGMMPAVWGKAPNADARAVDGPPVFGKAVDTIVEIDYLLSQIGRGFKYTMDPILAKTRGVLNTTQYSPSGSKKDQTRTDGAGQPIRTASNTIDVEPGGTAEFLEIEGGGLTAATDFVKQLREYALESIGGMKSDSETQKGAESGKAIELLYQTLVIVIKRQRLAWGNGVLLPLIDLAMRGLQKGELSIPGLEPIDPDSVIMRLKWPQWMTPTGADFLATVTGWQSLAGGSPAMPVPIFPRETVTQIAAANLGIQDAESLIDALANQADQDKQDALETQDKTMAIEAKHQPDKPPKGNGNQ
jgi:hypothetical protein